MCHGSPRRPVMDDSVGPFVDNFGTRLGASENAPFLPFGQAKTALALAPEGVHPQNVVVGQFEGFAVFRQPPPPPHGH